MNRGDIYYICLDPTVGSEIKKTRPALIISNNASNKSSRLITIIPITSNIKKIFPFEVLLRKSKSGLPKDSKAQCNQVRSVSIERIIGKRIGQLDLNILDNIENALMLHLGIK